MTQRLKNREIVPPDSFRYTVRETGYTVRARDWWTWMQKIKAHLKANDIPIPADIEAQAESQLCSQLSPEWCIRPEDTSWINTRLRWSDIVQGMKAFGKLLVGGFNFVEQPEAERRAWVCASCPYNVVIEGCGSCRKLAEFATGDIAKRTTQYDADLKACAVCHCSLAVKVHFPLDAIESAENSDALPYPDFCWLKRGGENYIPSSEVGALATA